MHRNSQSPVQVPSATGKDRTKVAYTISEAVKATGLSRSFLYEAMRRGELVARKAGSRTVIAGADLERYIAQLPTVSAAG